jgi:hypothetical protein
VTHRIETVTTPNGEMVGIEVFDSLDPSRTVISFFGAVYVLTANALGLLRTRYTVSVGLEGADAIREAGYRTEPEANAAARQLADAVSRSGLSVLESWGKSA